MVGFFISYISHHTSLDWSYCFFFLVLGVALLMWIFRFVPEYVPSTLIILTAFCLNIVPHRIILSGFYSNSFFRALTVFGVSAIISKSRLFYRFSIMLLMHIPRTQSFLEKCLFLIGTIMTPIMSVQSSRIALIAPLLDDIIESSQIAPRSDSANALANAAFHGCILLSTIFLTGKSSNFIIYGLLSEQNIWQSSWLGWLLSASFSGFLLLILFFTLQTIFFKARKPLCINRVKLKQEIKTLGPVSFDEYIALACLGTFSLGAIVSVWVNIASIYNCVLIFTILLTTKTFSVKDIKTRINWSFLFYFGTIIGVMRVVQSIGLDLWFINHFQWLPHIAHIHVIFFICIIYLISWLAGLILGTMIAPALLFTGLLPLALQSHINHWLIAFIILMATEAWVFPYQSSYFLCFSTLR